MCKYQNGNWLQHAWLQWWWDNTAVLRRYNSSGWAQEGNTQLKSAEFKVFDFSV